jgi:hypothetical protein
MGRNDQLEAGMDSPSFSIITATVGRPSLSRTISTVADAMSRAQAKYEHILVWDDKREGLCPDAVSEYPNIVNLVAQGTTIAATAKMGLGWCASKNEWCMSLDDDCWVEDPMAYAKIASGIMAQDARWGFCRRVLYDKRGERLGVDVYESIGNEPQTTAYAGETFCDMNTMFIRRDVAMTVSPYLCYTGDYYADRPAYRTLLRNHGPPVRIEDALVAYTLRDELVPTARRFCA